MYEPEPGGGVLCPLCRVRWVAVAVEPVGPPPTRPEASQPMNYAEDRLDRRARVVDDGSSASPLWLDFRQGLRESDHRRIACSLKDAGWNAHAVFHYAQAWLEHPADAEVAADYCQMVELAGYPATALVSLLVYRLSIPLRRPANTTTTSSRKDSGYASAAVDSDPMWLLRSDKRKNQHCGCGLEACGASECYFVVSQNETSTEDVGGLSLILEAVQDFISSMQQRYRQEVPTSHSILGDLAEQKRRKRYGNSKNPCDAVHPPLPSLFMFWEQEELRDGRFGDYRSLPLSFQLLAVKLLYLVMPAVAVEAVVRMTVEDTSPLLRGRFKSHRAFYVFILSLTLGERIKPGRRRRLPYSHEPLWDRLWAATSDPGKSTKTTDTRFMMQFQILVRSLESGNGGAEHSIGPLWLPPPFVPRMAIPLYFLGDSHVLSMAWQTLQLPNNTHVLVVPALVTGIKAWHVRNETRFFTHTCFQTWLSRLPPLIAVSAGEIDCREGMGGPLLEGYTTICCRDHVQKTVHAYVAALREIRRTCLVVPVAPHLHRKGNVDGQASRRETMRVWNQELREVLPATSEATDEDNELFLLDYADRLLAGGDDSYTLNPLFNADGTHLNAAFAPVLAASIETVMDRSQRIRQFFLSAPDALVATQK